MLTRRLFFIATTALAFPLQALASRPLTVGERRSLQQVQTLSRQEARRYRDLAASYASLALAQRATDPALSRNLTAVESPLRRAAAALEGAIAAFPDGVRLPSPTLRASPSLRQIPLPPGPRVPGAIIGPPPPPLTLETLLADTTLILRSWGDVGRALRALDTPTAAGLVPAAIQYETANTALQDANRLLGRISTVAMNRNELRDLEAGERLGDHHIDGLGAAVRASDTSESDVKKRLDDLLDGIIGKI